MITTTLLPLRQDLNPCRHGECGEAAHAPARPCRADAVVTRPHRTISQCRARFLTQVDDDLRVGTRPVGRIFCIERRLRMHWHQQPLRT